MSGQQSVLSIGTQHDSFFWEKVKQCALGWSFQEVLCVCQACSVNLHQD